MSLLHVAAMWRCLLTPMDRIWPWCVPSGKTGAKTSSWPVAAKSAWPTGNVVRDHIRSLPKSMSMLPVRRPLDEGLLWLAKPDERVDMRVEPSPSESLSL